MKYLIQVSSLSEGEGVNMGTVKEFAFWPSATNEEIVELVHQGLHDELDHLKESLSVATVQHLIDNNQPNEMGIHKYQILVQPFSSNAELLGFTVGVGLVDYKTKLAIRLREMLLDGIDNIKAVLTLENTPRLMYEEDLTDLHEAEVEPNVEPDVQ